MKRVLALFFMTFLALMWTPAVAAQTSCVCINGCALLSDPYPPPVLPTDPPQPTDCQLFKVVGGVATQISSGPPVLTSTLPVNNIGRCAPSETFPTGPALSVSCLLGTGNLAAGSAYSFQGRATNANGNSAMGPILTFTSVTNLPSTALPPATSQHVRQ